MSQSLPVHPPPGVSQGSNERAQDAARIGSLAQPVAAAPERRPRWTTLTFLAVTAGVAAVGLGGWAMIAESDSSRHADDARSQSLDRTAAVLADPQVQRIPLKGSVGRIALLVAGRGDAVLTLKGLGAAPAGRAYHAWITLPGTRQILPAGTFHGNEAFVPLSQWVTPGVRVSVTLENQDGVARPSRVARLTAVRRLG